MKRLFRLSQYVFYIFLFLFTISISSQENNLISVATFVSGEVWYKHSGKLEKVKINTVFGKDDEVATKAGKVDIQVGPNAILRLNNYTTLKFKELYEVGDAQKINLAVNSGNVYTKIIKKLTKNSEFKIENDTSVAGVRGTEFLISETKNLNKKYDDSDVDPGIYVNDGSVEAESKNNPNQKESLSAGQEVVTKGGEMKKGILQEYIKQKMEIFKTLDVMKEENFKLLKEQNEKNKSLMNDIIKGKNN
ncbi:MAG: FecR domain-containing protein [Leptospiraceae bacterium]|nr:FecR domain-containing protein [Leptospiraceae bacterium]MCK6382561.1 FecR domain-containing protein [Leptospiraceae bacterium]NUM41925.1 FecR domain-containing protein [Leptospiraceae bacterium]